MMGLLFLLCVMHVLWGTEAQDQKTYIITAPKLWRVDATETVLVQLFDYEQETTVNLYLKDSLAKEAKIYASQALQLKAQNNYQAAASLRIFQDIPKEATQVYLQAISDTFSASEIIPLTRNNGFLFIQTDKPLYTPEQNVEVRVYSFTEELRKSNRAIYLTFRDPDGNKMEIIELADINGVKPLLPPFKIPLKPKFGVWKIEATYTTDFSTTASAEFEVKEYVLPSISVRIKPEANYVSTVNFGAFKIKILAKYVSGAPVDSAEVFLKFGYIANNAVVMLPSTLRRYTMYDGELDVVLDIRSALSRMDSGPKNLREMDNHYLHVVVLLQESSGGISQEAILSNVKIVNAPFTLSLVATPAFIKPSLPYTIRVLVKDPLGEPMRGVAVKAKGTLFNTNQEHEPLKFLGYLNEITQTSQPDGVAYFICNIPNNAAKAEFTFMTADQRYPPESQAQLQLKTEVYMSINQRYLYIDLPSDLSSFEVDSYANIKIHFSYRDYLPLKTFSYQIISKGKVVKFATVQRVSEKSQNINFKVTADMVPSARLLVYYILSGEQKAELVADSVWLDIRAKCVNGLDVNLVSSEKIYKPKEKVQLTVKTKSDSQRPLVALSAIDMALYNLRTNDKDPMNKVLRHFEHSDLGCGGGGGQNNVDVFHRTGLTFLTNANAKASTADEACTAAVRPKRSTLHSTELLEETEVPDETYETAVRRKRSTIPLNDQFEEKAKQYGTYKSCCLSGTNYVPTLETCLDRTKRLTIQDRKCKKAFYDCCGFAQDLRAKTRDVFIFGRTEVSDETYETAVRRKRSTIPLNDQFEEKAKQYGTYKPCCLSGTNYVPTLETCLDRTKRLTIQDRKCKKAFYDCCGFAQDLRAKTRDVFIFGRTEVPDETYETAVRRKRSTIPLNDQFEEKANQYGPYKSCCLSGTESAPTLETCLDRTKRLSVQDRKCKKAFYDCCGFAQDLRAKTEDKIMFGRREVPAETHKTAVRRKRSTIPLNDQFEEKAKQYGPYKSCCLSGTDSTPTLETCLDRTKRLSVQDKRCKKAFYDCCGFAQDLRAKTEDEIMFGRREVPAETHKTAVRRKRSTIPLNDQFEEKAKQYGPYKSCCLSGTDSTPTLETCLDRTKRLSVQDKRCKKAFYDCCGFAQDLRAKTGDIIILSRSEVEFLLYQKTVQVRSYFPESWLWEEHEIDRSGSLILTKSLPDSLTTWEMKAVGVFNNGICLADPVEVRVTQALSVDVPVPYSMVRGEQIELKGSVYNQNEVDTTFRVTLKASGGVCVFSGTLWTGNREPHVNRGKIGARSVALVRFFIMALEVGTHELTFTLSTSSTVDTVVKKLRVVPEGARKEIWIGGRLDPQGVYGKAINRIELRNSLPPNIVPKSTVDRLLMVNGEVVGEMLSIITDPKGIMQLINLPRGSAEVELLGLLPIFYVFDYVEQTEQWGKLGEAINSVELKRKIKEGLTSIMSFKSEREHSFSLWKNKEPSTWLTALVVKTLAQVDKYVTVDHDLLSNTVRWLITQCQNPDGSFSEKSSYKPKRLMGAGADVTEQTVYLTSFVLIGIKNALTVPKSNLQIYQDALDRAMLYLSLQVPNLKSLYVRAITAYAMTLIDPTSRNAVILYEKLKKNAQIKGSPAIIRFWEEKPAPEDPLKPNKATALTVETTAYVLLSTLLRGDTTYAKPVLNWLTQDQRYGGGFFSTQDAILTLEAVTKYRIIAQKAFLNMEVDVSYRRNGSIGRISLSQSKPVGKPIEVVYAEDVILKTALSSGVSFANLRTVYYETVESNENCHFDISIDVHPRKAGSSEPMERSPRIVACAKYKPYENEVELEAGHTVMEINLPTGVSPVLEDLNRFRDGLETRISDYEINENVLVLQMDSIPSEEFYCVGFRIQEVFHTGMNSASLFKVYEFHDPDNQCSKFYHTQSRRLLRLCSGTQCQCMAAECCKFKASTDDKITAKQRKQNVCQDSIKYAFKVTITSTTSEGEFLTYNANVEQTLKKGSEDIKKDSEIGFVKKATCSSTNLEIGKQYLFMGAEIMQLRVNRSYKYKFPLDSQASVEWWPSDADCQESSCRDYVNILNDFEFEFTFEGCDGA